MCRIKVVVVVFFNHSLPLSCDGFFPTFRCRWSRMCSYFSERSFQAEMFFRFIRIFFAKFDGFCSRTVYAQNFRYRSPCVLHTFFGFDDHHHSLVQIGNSALKPGLGRPRALMSGVNCHKPAGASWCKEGIDECRSEVIFIKSKCPSFPTAKRKNWKAYKFKIGFTKQIHVPLSST